MMPTNTEIFQVLRDLKRNEPLKTNSWSPSELIKVLFFSHAEKLVKVTESGYRLTKSGHDFLESSLTFDNWLVLVLKDKIKKSQQRRLIILYEIYKETVADTSSSIDFEVAAGKRVEEIYHQEVKLFLDSEGMIKTTDNDKIQITHQGIKVIELAILFCNERPCNFFPPLIEILE